MKKKILIDRNAKKELGEFVEKIQIEFEAYFMILGEKGKFDFPES